MKARPLSRPSQPPARRLGAVVLSRASRGDSDLMVTFITAEKGLITALAKNARQSVRRFGGNLLRPGTAAWYYFRQRPGRDIAFVERGEINHKAPVQPPEPICSALVAWSLELVRAFEAHENPATGTFSLLLRHLGALSKARDYSPPALEARRLSLGFTKGYLELAGFAPRLAKCSICSRTDSAGWFLDPVLGGAICQGCQPTSGRNPPKAPEGLLAALRAITSHKNCPPLSETQLHPAETFFHTLATLHSGRRFKSRKVLLELLGLY
jgi:DNA repair protein RecO (recombination protein O)